MFIVLLYDFYAVIIYNVLYVLYNFTFVGINKARPAGGKKREREWRCNKERTFIAMKNIFIFFILFEEICEYIKYATLRIRLF